MIKLFICFSFKTLILRERREEVKEMEKNMKIKMLSTTAAATTTKKVVIYMRMAEY